MLHRHKYAVLGLVAGGIIVLISGIAFVAATYINYDGKCRTLGLFFGSGTTFECSFAEYLSHDLLLAYLLYYFGWVPVLTLLLPIGTGWWMDRRRMRQSASPLEIRPMGRVRRTMALLAMAVAPATVALIALSPLPHRVTRMLYENAPEAVLIRIAEGDDPAASYRALKELLRRALGNSLSDSAFGSLIARGLERQADAQLPWDRDYGSLLQVAYSQGRLSEADFRSYASNFLRLQIGANYDDMSSWPEDRRPPPIRVEIRSERRGAGLWDVDRQSARKIQMFVVLRLSGLALDERPIAMLRGDEPQSEIVLSYPGAGDTHNIRLATANSHSPGRRVLTGHVEITVKQGENSW
ncbi:MAG: hypothetical protein ACRD1X_04645, partial [Vicinamibacteria bacterium]